MDVTIFFSAWVLKYSDFRPSLKISLGVWSVWAVIHLPAPGVLCVQFGFWLWYAIVVVVIGTHKTCYV